MIMHCNYFNFNDKFYLQINDIVIRTACTSFFANVNISFKKEIIDCIIACNSSKIKRDLILYNHYINNIFIIYKDSETVY